MGVSIYAGWSKNGEPVERLVGGTRDGLRRAVAYLHAACRRAVNRPNSRNRRSGRYDNPSKPGEQPKVRTGFGRDNIRMVFIDEEDVYHGRVGVGKNAAYMIALELGATIPGRRIVPKRASALKIPWNGPVQMTQGKRGKKSRAQAFGSHPKYGQKYHAVLPNGKIIVVFKDEGGYFYFRKMVQTPTRQLKARPWLIPTLTKSLPAMQRLMRADLIR